jgi:hypothetical protein
MNVAGMRRPRRWHGALAGTALLGLMAAITLLSPAAGAARSHAPSAAPAAACARARGPFHVRGTQVIGKGGKVFIPYGITVPGLFHPRGYSAATKKLDYEKIAATANSWCANTVRLQISQAALVGPKPIAGFLKDIEGEVTKAESYHLVVVLNDQTESDPGDSPGPTDATVAFWKILTRVYHNDPQVIFDVFNEPRIKTGKVCGTAADWRIWQQGTGSFLGMQALVDDVYNNGAKDTLLWVEGPCFANSLAKVTSYPIRLSKPLVVYVFHHPTGPHNPAQWDSDFGYLVNRGIAAVVDGEWTNYAPIKKGVTKSECWSDAPTAAPAFLSYLQARGIGMTAYELAKGLLIETNNLADPTKIRSNWSCAAKKLLDEGAGSMIMNWYKRRNAA